MKHALDIPRTALEVFNMLPEGTLCEVIDNTLYMSPSPTTDHQDILGDLYFEIKLICRSKQIGNVFLSPLDVYLDNGQNVVQPDLLFIKTDNLGIVEQKGIYGAPDLVIEILSSNKSYDTEKKFELYQRNQIAEYIIIDPDTKQVSHYVLDNGAYIRKDGNDAARINSDMLRQEVSF